MEVLKDGDTIKLASWRYNYATVRARKGEVWATKSVSMITDNPSRATAHNDAQARAVVVTIGEIVWIGGKCYAVRVPRGNEDEARNSAPIHFVPALEAI